MLSESVRNVRIKYVNQVNKSSNMNIQNINSNIISLVTNIPDEYIKKFLKIALLGWQSSSKNCHHIVENISRDVGLSKDQTFEIIGVYISIVKLFLQNNYNEFSSKLLEIGFSTDFISKLSLADNQKELVSNLRRHTSNNFNKLSIIKWKIDISLMDSVISKKIPKPVILCLELNNGQKYTIRVDAKMFHKLRFNIALMLNELNSVKPLSKLAV